MAQRISIVRTQSNSPYGDHIVIEIESQDKKLIYRGTMELSDFAAAVTGLAHKKIQPDTQMQFDEIPVA